MFRKTTLSQFASFKLPPRTRISPVDGARQHPVTVPPPPVGEIGGVFGTSTRYSRVLSNESYSRRMARSTYELRMQENRTLYPMSEDRPGELDSRWLPRAFPDPLRNRPLLEVGEPDEIPSEMMVPVIFICNVKQAPRDLSVSVLPHRPRNAHVGKNAEGNNNGGGAEAGDEEESKKSAAAPADDSESSPGMRDSKAGHIGGDAYDGPGFRVSAELIAEAGVFQARQFETHYVTQSFMRRRLAPQRLAVYATPENYKLLGLPVRDLQIHAEVPKNQAAYQKLRAKQLWDNERWRFSFEMLFRKYERGPPELLDDGSDEWDGNEEVATSDSAGGKGGAAAGGGGAARKGPAIVRKAKKIKLF